ncbi:helix-turn-helix transcriptional regulator [Mesorhizobium sp. WSM3860]|uniref:helix-turn-helix domain-containing protein n=1 Tax=Mesorhizobium sp. WSM3860 TaxID=2029403 RepID=UPI000BB0050F|nr:helix-turn-helix transcriptional regulator [Mesorhizobium sp. WSM3860]PBC02657.1 hypothetical protein CK220_19485 [Mesorhizobium sp. WSM3860]
MDSREILSGQQLKAARALLNWSRVRLAAKANLSEATISEFENGFRTPNPRYVAAIRRALEGAGIVFPLEGSPSLTRFEAQHRTRDTDNRTWRRRQANRAP